MNKTIKVMATLATVATATMAVSPVAGHTKNTTLLARPSTTTKSSKEARTSSDLKSDTIKVTNVWNQSLFDLIVTGNNITVTEGNSEINPYAHSDFSVALLNSNRQEIKTVSFAPGSNPNTNISKVFNNTKMSVGDTLVLSSKTGTHITLDGSTGTGLVEYQMTSNGLKQLTKTPENLQALYNGESTNVTCKVEPNIPVTINYGNDSLTTTSNSEGLVNVNIKANLGDNIIVIPDGELESSTQVKDNPSIFKLQQQVITLDNVWNQGMATIGFNENNTLKVGVQWGETNPYYSGNDSLTVELLNNTGTVVTSKTFKGGVQVGPEIQKELNGLKFDYGDIIHIKSNSNANIYIGKQDYKNNQYFVLAKNGIRPIDLNNTGTLNAEFMPNGTAVKGKVNPNSKVLMYVDGKEYTTMSDSEGNFSTTLPKLSVGTVIDISSGDLFQPIVVNYNKDNFGLTNNSIKVFNNWGTDVVNMTFNPETMQINTNGWNAYLGSETPGNSVGVYLYHNGELNAGGLYNGDQNTSQFSNAFNNKTFSYGDIIGVCYNHNMSIINVMNGTNKLNTNGSIQYYKITPEGLVAYTPETQVNPLNIITSTPTYKFDVTGKTTPDTNISIKYLGEVFTGQSDKNGVFSVSIDGKTALNENDALVVSVQGQIPETIYASPSNMLQSNSGVYVAGDGSYFGKITFNPITMKIQWFDADSSVNTVASNPTTYTSSVTPANLKTVIDSSNKSNVFGFTLKDKTGKVLMSKEFTGLNTIGDIYNFLNSKDFSYGDTVTLYQNNSAIGFNVISNGKIVTPDNNTVTFEVTPNGLVDSIQGQSIYKPGFSLDSYYAGDGIVSTGQTATGYDASGQSLANAMVMNQAMKNRVDKAIQGCTTDYEKAKAIFNIVSPVPYVNCGGNTINTYEHGGVCFNKAQLYAVMCQYAGLVSRVVTGYANNPSPYQRYEGYHSWNQIWSPTKDEWITVDTTWHIFDCGNYVNSSRHSFSVQATLWNPKQSYTSYFTSDPSKAWENACTVWNSADYYNFNYSNNPEFQDLFKGIYPSKINLSNWWGVGVSTITIDYNTGHLIADGNPKSWLGHDNSHYMTIEFLNPKTGDVIYKDDFNGTSTVAELQKDLASQKFNVGDILKITFDNSQGSVKVTGGKGEVEDGGMYQITNEGLVPFTGSFSKIVPTPVIKHGTTKVTPTPVNHIVDKIIPVKHDTAKVEHVKHETGKETPAPVKHETGKKIPAPVKQDTSSNRSVSNNQNTNNESGIMRVFNTVYNWFHNLFNGWF